MKNKDLEKRISKTQDVVALWVTFHDLYKAAAGKENIAEEDERAFLEVKSELAKKYESLSKALSLDTQSTSVAFGVITQAISLGSISRLPEIQFKALESDWHSSYITLNKVLGDLENEKDELVKVSGLKFNLGKLLSGPISSFIILILVIIVGFMILVKFFNIDEKLANRLKTEPENIQLSDDTRIMFKWEGGEK